MSVSDLLSSLVVSRSDERDLVALAERERVLLVADLVRRLLPSVDLLLQQDLT